MADQYDERSRLLPHEQHSAINSGLAPPPRSTRADTTQSDFSVTSFGGASILGADTRDAQDLLDDLDRATNHLRRHLQREQQEDHIPVSRPLIPRWMTSYLLAITFIWQASSVGFLEAIDLVKTSNSTEEELRLASNIVMTVFQAVHLLLVFFVSYKLVKKVLHRTASGSLLAQSYLSTVLLFAGLYTLLYRFSHTAFSHVFDQEVSPKKKIPTLLFLRMLYFSVSTATLTGTSEVEPFEWYATVTVSVQMLLSFVYFASILSLGVISRRKPRKEVDSGKSLTQRLRGWMFRSKTI